MEIRSFEVVFDVSDPPPAPPSPYPPPQHGPPSGGGNSFVQVGAHASGAKCVKKAAKAKAAALTSTSYHISPQKH